MRQEDAGDSWREREERKRGEGRRSNEGVSDAAATGGGGGGSVLP